MARLKGPFSFTGQLGDVVAYGRKDLDGTCLRSKSSLNKKRLYSDAVFTNTLKNADEGGGRSTAAWWLRRVLHSLDPVRLGNWQGQFTGALTPVQHLDTQSKYGQRSVLFSRHGHLLEGFCLNSRTPFEQVLRNPVSFSLSKEHLRAEVTLSQLNLGVNFFAPASQPYFRVSVVLGVVPDLHYTPEDYKPEGDYSQLFPKEAYSDWYPLKGGAPATTLPLQLGQAPPTNAFGLVLAVGILFGAVNQWGQIEPVNSSGSGRILALR